MNAAVAVCLWFLAWGPNDSLLAERLDAADVLEHRLVPWRAVLEPALPLWIAVHERPALPAATFVAAEQWRPGGVLWLGHVQDLRPRLRVPRLLLAARHFRHAGEGGLKALEDLGPDSAERLLHALLEAHFSSRLAADDDLRRGLERRAGELMAEVPAAFRLEAYLSALTDFGAHVMSIGHEIGRHQRRRRARGESLCAVLDHPATLFGAWGRAMASEDFRGYRPAGDVSEVPEASPGAPLGDPARRGEWVMTRAFLEAADKRWLFDHLGVDWTGDPAIDFRFLCRPGEDGG